MAEKEPAFCPNCSSPAVRQGKVIVCEKCDASFRFTQEGPKLHELGPLEKRLAAVEEKIGIGQPEPDPTPEPKPEDNGSGIVDETDDEDDDL